MAIRSKEQLIVLLKLIVVNDLSLTRRNSSVRQKIWHVISKKLNQMQGAQKDIDGWKRSYYTWRLNTGKDYDKEVHKLINNVADDDYFYINVSDDELESDNFYDEVTSSNTQTVRLHELVSKNNELINSNNADDEALKTRLWLNISEELNAVPNAILKLTPDQWKKRVDFDRYKARTNRKPKKRSASIKTEPQVKRLNSSIADEQEQMKDTEFELLDNSTLDDSQDYDQEEYGNIDELIVEEPETPVKIKDEKIPPRSNPQSNPQQVNYNFDDDFGEAIDNVLNDDVVDDDEEEEANGDFEHDDDEYTEIQFKPPATKKHIKPTPIVNSFKYSQRIVSAVERLDTDVCEMKDLLKKTTQTLVSLENAIQQQCHKQDETNTLLKRNGQLLKMLVTEVRTHRI